MIMKAKFFQFWQAIVFPAALSAVMVFAIGILKIMLVSINLWQLLLLASTGFLFYLLLLIFFDKWLKDRTLGLLKERLSVG